MSVDTTPTSSLRRSPRISSAARSSAASSLTPLLTRTLNYEDIVAGTKEDYEVARVNAGVGDDEDTQQLAVSEATIETKVLCDVVKIALEETSNLGSYALSVKQTFTWSAFMVLSKS
jgi:hypothetical protein